MDGATGRDVARVRVEWRGLPSCEEIQNQVQAFICKAGQHLGCQPIAREKN